MYTRKVGEWLGISIVNILDYKLFKLDTKITLSVHKVPQIHVGLEIPGNNDHEVMVVSNKDAGLFASFIFGRSTLNSPHTNKSELFKQTGEFYLGMRGNMTWRVSQYSEADLQNQ